MRQSIFLFYGISYSVITGFRHNEILYYGIKILMCIIVVYLLGMLYLNNLLKDAGIGVSNSRRSPVTG